MRGGGVKNSHNQRYRESTCTKKKPRARLNNIHESSSDKVQPTSSEVTSSQRCLDTFVIVTAHKQVCANQQSLHVSLR